MGFEVGRGDAKLVFNFGRNGHRYAARQCGAGFVGHVARFRNENLVAGREQGPHGEIEGFADADGNENVGALVVINAVAFFLQPRDFPAQLRHSTVGGVGSVALLQSVNAAFPDRPRGHEVRFADAEGDDVVHFRGDVEEAADA